MNNSIPLSPEKPIFLIGYMGSGKTTLGRALAQATGLDFLDLDDFIVEREGKTIKEIFSEKGEKGFRELERDSLRLARDCGAGIIACGGGTPCFFDNMDFISREGISVWLDASIECLTSRLSAERSARPLLANISEEDLRKKIEKDLESRNPFYEKALIRFDSSRLDTSEEIQESVKQFLKNPDVFKSKNTYICD